MVTGKQAFGAPDVAETLAFVLTRSPDWSVVPASLSPAVRTLLQRCLERDRRRRVADISTPRFILAETSSLVGGEPLTPAVRSRLSWWRLWLVATATMLGAGIAAVLSWQ